MSSETVIAVVNNILMIVQGEETPSPASHERLFEILGQPKGAFRAILVSSPGGTPTVTQRKQIIPELKRHRVPLALLTSSARVRGALTAVSWFVSFPLRPFSYADVEESLRFLKQPPPFASARIALARMRRECTTLNGG